MWPNNPIRENCRSFPGLPWKRGSLPSGAVSGMLRSLGHHFSQPLGRACLRMKPDKRDISADITLGLGTVVGTDKLFFPCKPLLCIGGLAFATWPYELILQGLKLYTMIATVPRILRLHQRSTSTAPALSNCISKFNSFQKVEWHQTGFMPAPVAPLSRLEKGFPSSRRFLLGNYNIQNTLLPSAGKLL